MSLDISIIVPDRIFWRDNAKEVILPTLSGQMGVLKGHIPLLTGLDTGLILVRNALSNDWVSIVVMGGFALVSQNKLTILVNEAEFDFDINIEEAESNFLASKLALESVVDVKKKMEFNSQFKKAFARLKAVQKLKNI